MTWEAFLDRIHAFLVLRPFCDLRFLRLVWVAFALGELLGVVSLLTGTAQAYPRFSWQMASVTMVSVVWAIVRLALVRIFLEVAAVILLRGIRSEEARDLSDIRSAT
jgi:hypothetical protein